MSFLIVANWKMNGNSGVLNDYLRKLSSLIDPSNVNCHIVVCPPFTAFSGVTVLDDRFNLGAQDCFYEDNDGPYTGEISAKMLYECKCRYVILGHYERRKFLNETNHMVKLKAESAIRNRLIPIICIGETMSDRENGLLKDVLMTQCLNSLPSFGDFIVAYEPVWAIGNSVLPSLKMIELSLDIIYSYCSRVIYGGAVTQFNISNIMTLKGISGILVGNASLNIDSFSQMISDVQKIKVN